MINTAIKQHSETKKRSDNIKKGSIYLLPKWEKIKTVPVYSKKFFFLKRKEDNFLYRKFSSVNMIEKYSLKGENDKVCGNIDIKVYKDSVYIIDTDILNFENFENTMNILVQTAVEKALYNTSEKKVFINLSMPFLVKSKIRKFLCENEFVVNENQSRYEKNLFGEEYCLTITDGSEWLQKIHKMPLLINK